MIELYPQIRNLHIWAISLSGCLFALRGMGMLANARWPQAAVLRYLSYIIDTTLLVAGLMLVWILPSAMFANGWLTVKLILVVVYVAFGVFALRRGRTRGVRAACYVVALLVFASIVGIARMHNPWGWLLLWA